MPTSPMLRADLSGARGGGRPAGKTLFYAARNNSSYNLTMASVSVAQ